MNRLIRVIYLATLLFLGSGLLGISHNFYWNAKPWQRWHWAQCFQRCRLSLDLAHFGGMALSKACPTRDEIVISGNGNHFRKDSLA